MAVRCAVYTRVSSQKQTCGSSLAIQAERCLAFMNMHGFTLVGDSHADSMVFQDVFTGTVAHRPAYDRLWKVIRRRAIKIVIVQYADRWGRLDYETTMGHLAALKYYGVDLVIEDDEMEPEKYARFSDAVLQVFERYKRDCGEGGALDEAERVLADGR